MIPGFVIAYRNQNNKIVLYFYPGYDDNGNKIYANINSSKISKMCDITSNIDGSVKYIFNTELDLITCKIIENKTGIEHIERFENL